MIYINKKGERLSRKFPKWLWLEHSTRYNFAANYVRDKIVVDCACGTGIGSEVFLNHKAKILEGFDLSESAIKIAKIKCRRFSNSNFSVSSATSIPLSDNFCDVFISLETIEHIKNVQDYLKEINRILKEDGALICSTPNRSVTNPGKHISDKPWNKYHVREYNSDEFIELLNKFFKNVDLYGFNKIYIKKLNLINKLRKVLKINGFIWTNISKAHRFFFDKLSNYEIERLSGEYEYEYLLAVCKK